MDRRRKRQPYDRADRRRMRRDRGERHSNPRSKGGDTFDWGSDVAGELQLEGQRLLLPNRAAQKIRAALRLS